MGHTRLMQNAQVPEEDFELPEDMELGDEQDGGADDSGADDGQPDEPPSAADDFKDADGGDADKEQAPADGQGEQPPAQGAHCQHRKTCDVSTSLLTKQAACLAYLK